MRVHYTVLLAAAFLASVDAARDSTASGAAWIRSHSTDTNYIPVKRFLTKHKAMRTDESTEDEERGVFNVALLDDIVHRPGATWDDFWQNRQFKSMLRAETNAKEAYEVLKVNKVTGNLLESAEWKAWSTYVAMLDDSKADEAMAKALVSHLKSDKLSKMLAEAAKNPGTKDIATRLEGAQVKWWVNLSKNQDDIGDIFNMLKLNKPKNDIFESPQLATFVKFLDAFNKRKRGQQATVFEMFRKSYGDGGLMKLLVSAHNAKSSEATKMMDKMLNDWLEFTKSPYSVFKALDLDKAGDNFLSSPLLSTWVTYLSQFNEKLPTKKTTMIETFLKSFGDESLTKMLEAAKKVPATEQLALNLERSKTALFKNWMVEGVTPDYLFKNVLKLDQVIMARNPNTNIWRAYYNAYDKAYPGKLFSFNP